MIKKRRIPTNSSTTGRDSNEADDKHSATRKHEKDDNLKDGHSNNNNNSMSERLPGFWKYFRLTPVRLHQVMPYLFFLEVCGIGLYGILVAVPYLYGEEAFFHQAICCVMLYEILANWYFMAYTDTSFKASHFKDYDQLKIDLSSKSIPGVISKSKGKHEVESKHFEYNIFPYWSWSPCYRCDRWRPPRCYHCSLCNNCVLKRDHHCFFTRNCIGFLNQKYYIVFCVWSFTSQTYALVQALGYYFSAIWPHVTFLDLLPGFSLMRYVFNFQYGYTGFLVLLGWVLIGFLFISFMQIGSAIHLLTTGLITFEIEHKIDLKEKRSASAILKSVFGELWFLNFFVPLAGGRFAPQDDPFHWQFHSPPKRKVHLRLNSGYV